MANRNHSRLVTKGLDTAREECLIGRGYGVVEGSAVDCWSTAERNVAFLTLSSKTHVSHSAWLFLLLPTTDFWLIEFLLLATFLNVS